MLKISNISKSYVQRGLVLDKLNLEIEKGSTVAITGPSGSGKTTLLNILGLLIKPDAGQVFFNDEDITLYDADKAANYRNKNIGFVFQDHLLLPHLNLLENIMLPLLADKKQAKQSEVLDYAISLMERTGILELKDKYPSQVSGGEAQRATLVRALINKPKLLLADEPTGSLDAENAELLTKLLLELNKDLGTSLIVVTHSELLASKMGKQIQLDKAVYSKQSV